MASTMFVRFILRKNVRHPDREGTLYCRVTVDKVEALPFATSIKCFAKNWNPGAQVVKGRTDSAQLANNELTRIRNVFEGYRNEYNRDNINFTAPGLVKRYKEASGSRLSLLELFDAFIEERSGLVGIEISATTLGVDRTRRRALAKFLQVRGELSLRPENFTLNYCDAYVHWHRVAERNGHDYAQKSLGAVQQVLLWGVRREILRTNPMNGYEFRKGKDKELVFLDTDELGRISYYPFQLQALRSAAWCFVFQCWTGLAYADLCNLRLPRDIERGTDGRRWLRITRQKSTMMDSYECLVPLLPEAERILTLCGQQLPVRSNAKYNVHLKEVAAICGLSVERLTTHIGRKTAGVLLLNAGVRMEVVSKILGHKSVRITERIYARILDRTIAEDIERVFGTTRNHPLDIAPMRLDRGGAATGTDGVDWTPATPEQWRQAGPAATGNAGFDSME
ncbi:Phage integrase family protein [Hymenobacter gelipurpurascens]|uniref:Phage integrase family protein n=2 Tax=Hymenobacter gelipurpurascens TaxID=89968 RepID=A0A212TMX0_9BACT|nr:Phage integrase family protein [Hymenobacter gelipurpurascens]